MPMGKYYCDYCEKQFQDTPSARKRHISGVQHQRARAQWYDSFKDPYGGTLLQPDGTIARGVCHHFVRTGICKYGDSCKYFHPVRTIVNPTPTAPGLNIVGSGNLGGNQLAGGSSFSVNQLAGGGSLSGNQTGVSWGNLPPSLRPPPDSGYPPLPLVDWG